MSTSYTVRPEVAGGFGPETDVDASVHPPLVRSLHYVFEGWLGDDVVESFPCFLVTERLAAAIDQRGLTGAAWGEVTVTSDDQFRLLYPHLAGALPPWRWFQPSPEDAGGDFWVDAEARLHVSEAGLLLLREFAIDHALIHPD